MDPDTWNENKDRPAFVRRHRDELHEAIDVDEEIPRDLAGVESWLDRYKGTVTRQLTTTDGDESTDDEEADG